MIQAIKDLKTETQYFLKTADGLKPFELRKEDRNYKVGDVLALKDYHNGLYMDRFILVIVTYVLKGYKGLSSDYVIIGTKNLTGIVFDRYGLYGG